MKLVQLVQEATKRERESSKPMELVLGQVIAVSPLQINAEGLEKPLTEEFLRLSHLVQDHQVKITVDHMTESAALVTGTYTDYQSHSHAYKGEKVVCMQYGLKVGEAVLLLREQGGQRYFVLDRLAGDVI